MTDKSKFRSVIYEKYNGDTLINILECKYGLRAGGSFLKCYGPDGLLPQYVNHQKAAVRLRVHLQERTRVCSRRSEAADR